MKKTFKNILLAISNRGRRNRMVVGVKHHNPQMSDSEISGTSTDHLPKIVLHSLYNSLKFVKHHCIVLLFSIY